MKLKGKSSRDVLLLNNEYTKSYYPSDFIHGLLSAKVYEDNKKGDIVTFDESDPKSCYNDNLKGWKVARVFQPPDSDSYYSVLYVNEKEEYAVLAHRGQDMLSSSLKASIVEVFNRNIGAQQIAAYASTKESLNYIAAQKKHDKIDYHFSVTGHALGAWLAELSLYFCHIDFGYRNVRSVSFDSPGTADHIQQMRSNIKNIDTKINTNLFDLKTYLLAPNLINVCNKHIGKVYTLDVSDNSAFSELKAELTQSPENVSDSPIKRPLKAMGRLVGYEKFNPVKTILEKIEEKIEYAKVFLSVSRSGLDLMIKSFNPETGLPEPDKYSEVLDWPTIRRESNVEVQDVLAHSICKTVFMVSDACIAGVPDIFLAPAEKLISQIIPNNNMTSLLSVMITFLSGNIELIEMFGLFEKKDSDKKGNLKIPKSSGLKESFELSYQNHYRVVESDPYKSTIVKGKPEWYLESLSKCNVNQLNVPLDVKKILDSIKRAYQVKHNYKGTDQDVILSKDFHIDFLCNQVKNLMGEYKQIKKLLKGDQLNLKASQSNPNISDYFNSDILKLPEKLQNFVSKGDLFEQVDSAFNEQQFVIISGFLGVGKTTFASEYGHLKQKLEQLDCYWFDASSPEKMKKSYQHFASQLAKKDCPSYIPVSNQYVSKAIEDNNDELLLIFDKVTRYDDIKPYILNLPEVQVKVLITTRHSSLFDMKHKSFNLELKPFSFSESVTYVLQALNKTHLITKDQAEELVKIISPEEQDVQPNRLVKLLEGLQGNSLWSIADYIKDKKEKFSCNSDDLMLNQTIKENSVGWKMLQYGAFLDFSFIGVGLFKELLGIDEIEMNLAFDKLANASLLSVVRTKTEEAGFVLNENVADSVRRYMKVNKYVSMSHEIICKDLLSCFNKLMPLLNDKMLSEDWKIAKQIYPHSIKFLENDFNDFDKTPFSKELFEVYVKIANYEKNAIFRFELAFSHYEEAMKLSDKPIDKVKVLISMADICSILGNFISGKEFCEKAKNLVDDLDENKEDLYGQVFFYMAQNSLTLEDSIKYHQKALNIRKKIYGNESFEMIQSLSEIGKCYNEYSLNVISHGDFKRSSKLMELASQYYNEVLNILTKMYKQFDSLENNKSLLSHYIVANFYDYFGTYYMRMKQYNEASDYIAKSQMIRKEIFPDNHLDHAFSFESIADLHFVRKDYAKALKCYNYSLGVHSLYYEENHHKVFILINKLGMCYHAQNINDLALNQILCSFKIGFILDNPKYYYYISKSLFAIEEIVKVGNSGDFLTELQANQELLKKIALINNYKGQKHISSEAGIKIDSLLVKLYLSGFKGKQNNTISNNDLLFMNKLFLEMYNMPNVKLNKNLILDIMEVSTNIQKSIYGAGSLKYAKLLCNVVRLDSNNLFLDKGKKIDNLLEKSIEFLEKALEIGLSQKESFGKNSVIAKSLHGLSAIFKKLDPNKSIEYQEKLLNLFCINNYYTEAANALNCLSELYDDIGYYSKANQCRKQSSAILKAVNSYYCEEVINPRYKILESKYSLLKKDIIENLEEITKLASTGTWSSGYFITVASPIVNFGIKGYVKESYLKKILDKDFSDKNLETIKILCFEAICAGVAMNTSNKLSKYDCLNNFKKMYPDIVKLVVSQYQELFFEPSIIRKVVVKWTEYGNKNKILNDMLVSSDNLSNEQISKSFEEERDVNKDMQDNSYDASLVMTEDVSLSGEESDIYT